MEGGSIRIDTVGTIVKVQFEPREGHGTLTEGVLSDLSRAFDTLISDVNVSSVCLCGHPAEFLLGADVPFFVHCLKLGDFDRILHFTRTAQDLLRRIELSGKPVIAWVQGMAIGGGLEMALACRRIVAAPDAKFSLPETGLGIYPGMGGTQRTPRRIGIGLAKWMIYTGAIVPADQALEIGLIDAVHPTARTPYEAMQAGDSADRPARRDKFSTLENLFTKHTVSTLLDPAFSMPSEPEAVRALIQMRSKAPLALRLAETVIDLGSRLPLDVALEEEMSHLAEVFASQDALAGLASIGQIQRPHFVGR